MKVPRRAMSEDDFWSLIVVLEGSTRVDAVERLTESLRARGTRSAIGFQERLAATLFELDREVLFRQPVRWVGDNDEDEPVPLSDDTFLYLRASVVAQGRQFVGTVLSDPAALLSRNWEDGEPLLHAAANAVEGDIETGLSYETGSNSEYWSAIEAASRPFTGGVVHLSLCDLSEPIEAYGSDGSDKLVTIEYAPPLWFPIDIWFAVNDAIGHIVYETGGVPDQLVARQISVEVAFGDEWSLSPMPGRWAADGELDDDTVYLRMAMREVDVRAMSRAQQEAALRSVTAICVLSVLPPEHLGRERLLAVTAEAAGLLPPIP